MDTIPGAGMLGYGFKILGPYDTSSLTGSILARVGGQNGTRTFGGITYSIPNNVNVLDGSGGDTTNGTAFVAKTQQDFQSYFSAQLQLHGSYNGFSGEFEAYFARQARSQEMYWYGLVRGSYEGWRLILEEESQAELSSDFSNDEDVQTLMALDPPAFTTANQEIFFRVFRKWGTHLVYQVALGGSVNYLASVETSYSSEQDEIESRLKLEYRTVFVDAGAEAQVDWNKLGQQWSDKRHVTIAANGGDSNLLNGLDPTLGSNFSTAFQQWNNSIMTHPQVTDFYLRDLSVLFSGELARAVSQALDAYTNKGVYVSADFTAETGMQHAATASGLITMSGDTISDPSPPPSELGSSMMGAFQLAVFDATTLETLVDVGAVADLDQKRIPTQVWTELYEAVQGLTRHSYIVALAAFGVWNASGFPIPAFATWLEGCGASLSMWRENTMGEQDRGMVNYVFIGQQGLPPGHGVEKFDSNFPSGTTVAGDFFANATAPLIPSPEGRYVLSTPNSSVLLNRAELKRAALERSWAPSQTVGGVPGNACVWQGYYWPVGSRTCFDGTERYCSDAGWTVNGPC